MAKTYNAGNAHVTVSPDTRKFATELKAQLKKVNERLALNVRADTTQLKTDIHKAVQEVERGQSATIKVALDPHRLKDEIRAVTDGDHKVTINADADTASAEEQINSIGGSKVTINADADTAPASAKLAIVSRRRLARLKATVTDDAKAEKKLNWLARTRSTTIKVAVDAKKANADLAALQSLAGSTWGYTLMAQAGSATLGLGTLATAAGGVIGPLSAMGSIALTSANALWALPAAAGAAGFGLASLITGLNGVGQAFGAMGKSAGGGGGAVGSAADDMAKRVQQAERTVVRAQRGIEKANRQVRDSERSLMEAQKRSQKAQEDLNRARVDAVDNLREMNKQLSDAALDEEDAVLAVARAKQDLQRTMQDGDSSKLDIAEADLAYRKAIKTLEDTREANNELARDVAAANRAGIEGSEGVVKAKEAVEDAQYSEMKAHEALEDAQIGVIEANEALTDAQQALADAMNETGAAAAGAAGGIDPFAEAMARLHPEAQEFVRAIQDLGPAWTDLRKAAQGALFDGLAESITELAEKQLPNLKKGFVDINTELNRGFNDTFAAFSTDDAQKNFQEFLANTRDLFAGLADAAEPVSELWIKLATAGSRFFEGMGKNIADTFTRWNEESTVDSWEEKIQRGLDAWRRFSDGAGEAWGVVQGVFRAASASGDQFLGSIGLVTKEMHKWVDSDAGQQSLINFFTAMTQTTANLIPVITAIGEAIGNHIVPFIERFTAGAGEGVATMFERLGTAFEILKPAAEPLGSLLGALASSFGGLLVALAPVITAFTVALAPILERLAPVIVTLGATFAVVGAPLIQTAVLITKIGGSAGALVQVFNILMGAAKILWGVLSANPIGLVITAVVLLTTGIITLYKNSETFRNICQRVGNFLRTAFKTAFDIVRNAVISLATKVVEAWQRFEQFKTRVTNNINAVKVVIRSLPDVIKGYFRNASTFLLNAGQNIISGLLDGLKQGWRNVTSWFSNSVGSFFLGGGAANAMGSYSPNATGSIRYHAQGGAPRGLQHRRVSHFAAGGREDHSPQFVRGGDVRIFAEPETKGELYIPLANDYRRPRAEALLAAGAGHFGFELTDPTTGKQVKPSYQGSLQPVKSNVQAFAKGGVTGGITVKDMDDFGRTVQGKPYGWGGTHWGDCTGWGASVAAYAKGMNPWVRRFYTGDAHTALPAMGIPLGRGKAGDLRFGWWNGGAGGGHMRMTLPSGVHTEMVGGGIGGLFGGNAEGAASNRTTTWAYLSGDHFKPVEIPKMAEITATLDTTDLEDVESTGTNSADALIALRESEEGSPDAYGDYTGSASDQPTTWSGMAGKVAEEFVSGHVSDILGVFGINDELPPALKAYQEYEKAQGRAEKATPSMASRAANEVEKAAEKVIAENPDVETETTTKGAIKDEIAPPKNVVQTVRQGDDSFVYDPKGGAAQWKNHVNRALSRHGLQASANTNVTIQQIDIESSGNPKAVNNWDSNAAKGTPSGGLLQVIKPTFDMMRGKYPTAFNGLPNNHFDPMANLTAGIAWARYKYGAPQKIWPTRAGYKDGGSVWGAGTARSDSIPAMLSNGEFVMPTHVAREARPLLEEMRTNPEVARSLNRSFITGNRTTQRTNNMEVHYHIETNNVNEGLRRAEMQHKRQVLAMSGVR